MLDGHERLAIAAQHERQRAVFGDVVMPSPSSRVIAAVTVATSGPSAATWMSSIARGSVCNA